MASEKLNEMVEEHHHKAEGGEDHDPGWMKKVSLSMAIISVITAVSNMQEGHTGNEAILFQLRASDQWSYYQAKGIKAEITSMQGEKAAPKVKRYKKEQEEISKEAKGLETESRGELSKHIWYSYAVVSMEVAITVCAVAALTHNPLLWYGGMGMAVIGTGLDLRAYTLTEAEPSEEGGTTTTEASSGAETGSGAMQPPKETQPEQQNTSVAPDKASSSPHE